MTGATKARLLEWFGPLSTLVILCLLLVGATGLAQLGTASLQRELMTMLVNVVVVVGLYVFIGNTGVFSFGQLAFMGIGGYAAAILVLGPEEKELLVPAMLDSLQSAHLGPVPAMIAGGIAAAVFAVILCPPLMRLQGLNAGLATFAVLIIVNVVANNLEAVTNGAPGIANVPTIGVGLLLIATLAAVALAWLFQQTSFCRRARAVRDDEPAARSIGINPTLVRSVAFVVSAFIVGLGGAFFAQVQGAFEPTAFYLSPTLLAMAMLVVGGKGSLSGAVVGVLVLSALSRILGDLEAGMGIGPFFVDLPTGVRDVGLALTMLIILIKRPNGLMNGRELSIRWPRRNHPSPPQDTTNTEAIHDDETRPAPSTAG